MAERNVVKRGGRVLVRVERARDGIKRRNKNLWLTYLFHTLALTNVP